MSEFFDGFGGYCWVITVDFLEIGTDYDESGTYGPYGASVEDKEAALFNGHEFFMYDDDGILYYGGKIVADEMDFYADAPLVDFGTPNAGAVTIKYPDHPEWNCG